MTAQIQVGKLSRLGIKLSDLLTVEIKSDNKYELTDQGVLDLAVILLNLEKRKINGLYSRLNSLFDIINENNLLLRDTYSVVLHKEKYKLFCQVYPAALGVEYNPGILEISLTRQDINPVVKQLFFLGGSILDEIHAQSKQLGGN